MFCKASSDITINFEYEWRRCENFYISCHLFEASLKIVTKCPGGNISGVLCWYFRICVLFSAKLFFRGDFWFFNNGSFESLLHESLSLLPASRIHLVVLFSHEALHCSMDHPIQNAMPYIRRLHITQLQRK